MLLVWTVCIFLVGFAQGAEVCYENLGCFTDDMPWSGTAERPIARLPWSPEKIGTKFLLFTRKNIDNFQEIATDKDILQASNYDGSKMTRFITHGFIDQGDENWLLDMCRIFLQVEDINCICVDWKRGGRTSYTQSANNIRVIGAQLAYMIELFQTIYQQKPNTIHIIGHSLGAHLAGETGRRIPNLARITGLDPAEPYFQGCPILVRLDPSDANFVDVIHTDSLPVIPYMGFGMSQAIGHLDFYPNRGEHMPGCDKNVISQIVDIDGIWEGTRDFVACNHLRSYKYYNGSILNPEGFLGYPCSNGDVFDEFGRCFPCADGACPFMGHHADKFHVPNGQEKLKFYLNTGDARPFGRYRYLLTVTIAGDRTVTGTMKVALYGTNGNTRQHEIHNGLLSPGKTYEAYIDAESDMDEVTRMKFIWSNKVINPLLPKFGATKMVLQRGKDRRTFLFCGKEQVREDVLQTLEPCN
ncbi:inactive pancreatic lipase-related protein 1-like [Scleropages formosus]|uniref:Triacylglycerol lipase n=1 Tax=Scleropages formosus TaxID=113540 RepID=A0A8C9WNK6_SCLFO|nr:inactive pancreatic lipase-related protein 1-like [Scleropages formosus]